MRAFDARQLSIRMLPVTCNDQKRSGQPSGGRALVARGLDFSCPGARCQGLPRADGRTCRMHQFSAAQASDLKTALCVWQIEVRTSRADGLVGTSRSAQSPRACRPGIGPMPTQTLRRSRATRVASRVRSPASASQTRWTARPPEATRSQPPWLPASGQSDPQ